MTGPQVFALIAALYLLFELIAIPFGHSIGKRVSWLRIFLILFAGCYLAYLAVSTYTYWMR